VEQNVCDPVVLAGAVTKLKLALAEAAGWASWLLPDGARYGRGSPLRLPERAADHESESGSGAEGGGHRRTSFFDIAPPWPRDLHRLGDSRREKEHCHPDAECELR
jgi:hypothetical protein